MLERNSAEKAWLDAKLAKQPDEMVATLQQKYDAARATESAAIRTVNQDLDRRRKEELKVLMEKVGVVYRKVGSESGYMLLFQASEAEPAYVFDHRYDHANCDTKDDLTQQVVDALNQSDAQTR